MMRVKFNTKEENSREIAQRGRGRLEGGKTKR